MKDQAFQAHIERLIMKTKLKVPHIISLPPLAKLKSIDITIQPISKNYKHIISRNTQLIHQYNTH